MIKRWIRCNVTKFRRVGNVKELPEARITTALYFTTGMSALVYIGKLEFLVVASFHDYGV